MTCNCKHLQPLSLPLLPTLSGRLIEFFSQVICDLPACPVSLLKIHLLRSPPPSVWEKMLALNDTADSVIGYSGLTAILLISNYLSTLTGDTACQLRRES